MDDRRGRTGLFKRKTRDRVWLLAWLLTIALHAGAVVFFQSLPPLQAAPAKVRPPEPIRLVFAKPAPEARTNEKPYVFSELPPDRADAAPKQADFLSNVTSRARDRVPGGDTELPRLAGESDAPGVRLSADAGAAHPAAAATPAPPSTDPAGAHGVESVLRTGSKQDAVGNSGAGSALPKAGADPLARAPGEDAANGAAGNSDTDQPEMSNPQGNASLLGDVSLNTTAWDYAPWLQRFARQLRERWYPPPAYLLGILKEGGWALIEVEISPSGKLLRLDLLEEQGHPSLINAAQSALRSMAPIESLPKDFPEPTLVLRIRMIYPKVRPR